MWERNRSSQVEDHLESVEDQFLLYNNTVNQFQMEVLNYSNPPQFKDLSIGFSYFDHKSVYPSMVKNEMIYRGGFPTQSKLANQTAQKIRFAY